MTRQSIAIVGAGLAGLACAGRLTAAGCRVRVFDKARGPGGRLASRRVTLCDGREVRFDHGAQHITARDPGFANLCAGLERQGAAASFPWPVFGGPRDSDAPGERRYVGAPGMNAIAKALADPRALSCGRQVIALTESSIGWRLTFDDGSSETGFTAVIVATPAEQAASLVAPLSPVLAREARAARTAPCWAGLFVFEGGGEPAFGALHPGLGGPLAWLARTGDGQGWVAHASAAWSRLNLEAPPEVIVPALESAVRRLLPDVGATLSAQAHRWRYAQVEVPAASPYGWDPDLRLGVCGDWRLGPQAEDAWRSGDLLGAALAGANTAARA